MLDLDQIASFFPEPLRPFKTNLLREYLQYKILEALSQADAENALVFMGGTCIHLIHANPRFSEDLDFDNRGASKQDFETSANRVANALSLEGYEVELKTSFKKAFRAHFRFPNLLYDTGISGHWESKLAIHVDADPQNFKYEPIQVVINKFEVTSRINVTPVDILLAQKIACIFNRPRPMGRDFFDVVHLFGRTRPHMGYLANKLGIKSRFDLKDRLIARCSDLNFKLLAEDVKPFIYRPKDMDRIFLFRDWIHGGHDFSAFLSVGL